MRKPVALHPHLKRGIDYEPLQVDPADALDSEHGSHDEAQRAAKRRRLEAIVTQYLKGNPPRLLSTSLRRPLDKAWKNPWAKEKRHAIESRIGKPQHSVGYVQGYKAKDTPTHENVRGAPSRAKSPEISRTAHAESLNSVRYEEFIGSVTAPFPTASNSKRQNSIDTEHALADEHTPSASGARSKRIHRKEWLRRPPAEPERSMSEGDSATNFQPSSPTPSRPGRSPRDDVQKAFPVLDFDDIRHTSPKAKEPRALELHRSSMDIHSLGRATGSAHAQVETMDISESRSGVQLGLQDHLVGSRHTSSGSDDNALGAATTAGAADFENAAFSQRATQHVQPAVHAHQTGANTAPANAHNSLHDMNGALTDPVAIGRHQVDHELPGEQLPDQEASLQNRFGEPNSQECVFNHPSRDSIQKSVERCVLHVPVLSVAKLGTQRRAARNTADGVTAQNPAYNSVASPTPNSSTGFAFERVGKSKNINKGPRGSRPKPVKVEVSTSKSMDDISPPQGQTRFSTVRTPPRDIYDVMSLEKEIRDRSPSRRESIHSTQAALTLARLGFQEGSFPSPVDDNALAQTWETTPGPADPIASITPFHAFNAELDKEYPLDSLPDGPPISTQDLLDAASPFAFSTAKKKAFKPLARSNLRFAVLPDDGVDEGANMAGQQSPTPPADRASLKDRGVRRSIQSTANSVDRGSQEASTQDVEDTTKLQATPRSTAYSFDREDLSACMDFTARFLRNLDAVT
ncbi:hypothetical protein EJ04DRAFT_259736 [Polyplosphaeria fusca]|uniref:Uncharacterized protein n=1 Tax=Polyplosphaeria fusca TaxID=682080 RepID=A0A9P4R9U4_9PLEO|nr:hypothetical protein EJ04DRAFT_259736 [Polyplosphaeria fusca]